MTAPFQEMASEIIAGLTAERDGARALARFYHELLRRMAANGRDTPGLAALAATRAEMPWLKAEMAVKESGGVSSR